jgi:hypothetical protein
MKGQWLGGYSGSTDGLIVVDVDETVDGFAGYALLDFDKPPPQPFVAFETQTKAQDQRFSCAVAGVVGGQVERADVLSSRFPSYRLATRADVTLEWGTEQITLHWTTDIGTVGIATLPRSRATEPSTLPSQRMTWDAFKSHVSSLPFRAFAFRGQERKWRLRTSYHRTGRANLERFIQQDMQALHRHLRARTRHFFNLNVPDENGAFLNLIQHHGYPTPILDWTYSPFVAAYFAFSRIAATAPAQSDDTTAEVRVLLLDTARCVAQFPPVPLLTRMGPHFSLMEFSSVENERMIPQHRWDALHAPQGSH